jgi:hypothetical protein
VVGHVLLHQTPGVRDLPLLVDVVILHVLPEGVLIGLDELADFRKVEGIRIGTCSAEVLRQLGVL